MPRNGSSRGRTINVGMSIAVHSSRDPPSLKKLATQFLDPLINYTWTSGVDPLNRIGDPNLWIHEVSQMMHNHQLAIAGVDLDAEVTFWVKWHKEYLAELKNMHELPEPVDDMGRHPPMHILQQGEAWWDTMAKSGDAGQASFTKIGERLKALQESGVGGDPTEMVRLMTRVLMQSLASGAAARQARRMKKLYSRCIKERVRIAAEMGEKEEQKQEKTRATKKAENAEPTEVDKAKEKTPEDLLEMINATIQRLEGSST